MIDEEVENNVKPPVIKITIIYYNKFTQCKKMKKNNKNRTNKK